jgi:hypothetical protein
MYKFITFQIATSFRDNTIYMVLCYCNKIFLSTEKKSDFTLFISFINLKPTIFEWSLYKGPKMIMLLSKACFLFLPALIIEPPINLQISINFSQIFHYFTSYHHHYIKNMTSRNFHCSYLHGV